MKPLILIIALFLALALCVPAFAVDRPFIADTFFYWYTWDYTRRLGGWMGGVYNTPLAGYYDSRTYRDNYRQLWMASEWGMTDHFMDYWAPDWKADTGEMREAVVMRAAEDLRKQGYHIRMSYYQDGENFAMDDFTRNLTEKRDVYQWLRDFSKSPVWPKINGYPFQLVYSRNGSPKITITPQTFQAYLRSRYGSLDRLNARWKTRFARWEAVEPDFSATGHQRAEAIHCQYRLWKENWDRLDALVRKEFGYPGMRASFDVAYSPYMGFSYALFAKTFGGPHSYGGIFDQPHAQDAERFIQSIIAKKYNTLFFDHLKNFYHDWEIRIPGTGYLPAPAHFDRFWVGNLMRYNEGVLHLSWNEWWEGSNLEPSEEFGKTYCEKNLFYSTIMQECFPAIRDFGKKAKAGLLFNDWMFLAGGRNPEDLYQALQSLRASNVPFDLIVDDLATASELDRFSVIIAPAGRVGFGENARGESISSLLWKWLRKGKGRKLIVSDAPEIAGRLGLKEMPPVLSSTGRGPDMNCFMDIGAEGDDRFLLSGMSGREDWGRLPPGDYGAGSSLTVRWTPAMGKITTLKLPFSPNREHLLRLQGSALWGNVVNVLLDGQKVGAFQVREGIQEYALRIPASAIGARRQGEIDFVYSQGNIPSQQDPGRFAGESRVCNLALNWVQISTSNIGRSQEQRYRLPKERILLKSPLAGGPKALESKPARHRPLAPSGGQALSTHRDGTPRDLLFKVGDNQLLYVNGLFSEITAPEYWEGILFRWAKLDAPVHIRGKSLLGAELETGDTRIWLAYHEDISSPTAISVDADTRNRPIAEVRLLSKDGQRMGSPVSCRLETEAGRVRLRFTDRLRYYAVYQAVFSPVQVIDPKEKPVLHPGETRAFRFELRNLTGQPVSGTFRMKAHIPTLTSKPVSFTIPPKGAKPAALALQAKETVDRGRKTVLLEIRCGGRTAYFWRELVIEPNPDIRVATPLLGLPEPKLTLINHPHRLMPAGVSGPITLKTNGDSVAFPSLASGGAASQKIPLHHATVSAPQVIAQEATLACNLWGRSQEKKIALQVGLLPDAFPRYPDARIPVAIFNPSDLPMNQWTVNLRIPDSLRGRSLYLRGSNGEVIPSHTSDPDKDLLLTTVTLPPKSGTIVYLCEGTQPASETSLKAEARDPGTGHGTLKISNQHYSILLDEARGGTVTSFKSFRTGLDYGGDAFGAAYGTFSRYNPKTPAVTATQFIQEQKTRQADHPARIEILEQGPLAVVVGVSWEDECIKADQIYSFEAGSSFRFKAWATWKKGRAQEMAVCDARFKANRWTKIYPNFTGISASGPQPHFGWRQAGYIPPVVTFMAPDRFEESISFLKTTHFSIGLFRQGLWPPRRPEPGDLTWAEAEYALPNPRPGSRGEVEFTVLLHSGHQAIAEDRDALPSSIPVIWTPEPKWKEAAAP